jgi:hypothetical protein
VVADALFHTGRSELPCMDARPHISARIQEISLKGCHGADKCKEEYSCQKLVALTAAQEAGWYRIDMRQGQVGFLAYAVDQTETAPTHNRDVMRQETDWMAFPLTPTSGLTPAYAVTKSWWGTAHEQIMYS